ncbi:MAG: hypothetical protein ACMUJM_07035 [bacterium]
MDETLKDEIKSSIRRLREIENDYKERMREGEYYLAQLKFLVQKEEMKKEIEDFNKKLIELKYDYEHSHKEKISEMIKNLEQKLTELENARRVKI